MADVKKPVSDPWEQEAANFKDSPQAHAPTSAGNDDWKIWQQGATDSPAPEPSMLQKVMSGAEDVGKGMLKGAGQTANNIGSMLIPDHLVKMVGGTPPTKEQQASYFEPTNTAQKVGKVGEQAAEWLAPTGLESEAAKALPAAPGLARVAMQTLEGGARNVSQGGSFKTGAEIGGVTGGLGEGMRSVAPKIAESALGVRKIDRAYGRTPGEAILTETHGVRPSTIEASAKERLGTLGNQLESSYRSSPNVADIQPARAVLGDAVSKAAKQGEETASGQLQPMANRLVTNPVTGSPVPQQLAPIDLLDLKRGFGNEFVHRWNPETMQGTKSTAGRVYHALDAAGDAAVPEGADLNSRISSLIPVAKRAESVDRNASLAQRAMHRVGAHTGALTGAMIGGGAGYEKYGPAGVIPGMVGGVLIPEALASPTGQMIAARTMASPATPRLMRGATRVVRSAADEDSK